MTKPDGPKRHDDGLDDLRAILASEKPTEKEPGRVSRWFTDHALPVLDRITDRMASADVALDRDARQARETRQRYADIRNKYGIQKGKSKDRGLKFATAAKVGVPLALATGAVVWIFSAVSDHAEDKMDSALENVNPLSISTPDNTNE